MKISPEDYKKIVLTLSKEIHQILREKIINYPVSQEQVRYLIFENVVGLVFGRALACHDNEENFTATLESFIGFAKREWIERDKKYQVKSH